MLGIVRTTLALMVMVYHLWLPLKPLGLYSVFGFYVISGYLMTLVMQERYGYTPRGRAAFALNRALRLYPQYWAAAGLSLLLIFLLGESATRSMNAALYLPETPNEILANVAMVFPAWHPIDYGPRLVPPTWALTVELTFYALIGAGISRTPRRVAVWLALSVLYVGWTFAAGLGWESRYFPLPAASLPFALGSALYFLPRARLPARPLFLVALLNCLAWAWLAPGNELGVYLNLALVAGLVAALIGGGSIVRISRRRDSAIGDYCYPIYLLHWQAALMGWALPVVWLLSAAFIRWIDLPVQRIRGRIKSRAGISDHDRAGLRKVAGRSTVVPEVAVRVPELGSSTEHGGKG